MDRQIERDLGNMELREYGVARGNDFAEGFIDRFGYDLRNGFEDALKKATPELQKTLDKELSKVRVTEREIQKIASSEIITNLARKVGTDYGTQFTKSVEDSVRTKLANAIADGARTVDLPSLTFGFTEAAIREFEDYKVFEEREYNDILFRQAQFRAKKKIAEEKEAVAALKQKERDAKRAGDAEAAELARTLRRLAKQRERDAKDALRQEQKKQDEEARAFSRHVKELEKRYFSLASVAGTASRAQRKALKTVQAEIKALGATFNDADVDTDVGKRFLSLQQAVGSSRGGLKNYANSIDLIAEKNGRAFGKGSRSDVLNFFGSLTGNLSRLPATGLRALSFIGELAGELKDFKNLGKTIASGGSAIGALARGLGAAAAGAAILVPILSVLITLMSGLLGIATALANVISFALVGGAAILGGTFVALAAGIGAAVIAFKRLNDVQKKLLKDSFEPFVNTVKGLGNIMAGELSKSFETWGKNVNTAFQGLEPLARSLGSTFGAIGTEFTAMLNAPGFQLFLDALSQRLPNILANLGSAFTRTFSGLSAVFAAVMPAVERFSAFLARIAGEFNAWASSTKGQRELTDFFDRAEDSAKSFFGFLGEVGGLLKDLLFDLSGNDVGKGIFDSLTKEVRKFRDYIADGRLEKWFEQARKLAGPLGNAIKKLASFVSKFVSDGALDVLISGFEAFEVALDLLEPVIRTFQGSLEFFSGVLALLAGDSDKAKESFGDFAGSVIDIAGGLIGTLNDIAGAAKNVADTIGSVFGHLPGAGFLRGVETGNGGGGKGTPGQTVIPGDVIGRKPKVDSAWNGAMSNAGRKAGEQAANKYYDGVDKGFSKKGDSAGKKVAKKISGALRKQVLKYLRDDVYINPKSSITGLVKLFNQIPRELAFQTRPAVEEIAKTMRDNARAAVDDAYSSLQDAARNLLEDNTKENRKAFTKAKAEYKKMVKELANANAAANKLLAGTVKFNPIQNAFKDVGTDLLGGLADIAKGGGGAEGIQDLFKSIGEDISSAAEDLVSEAQDSVGEAYDALLGSTTKRQKTRNLAIFKTARNELLKTIKAYENSKIVQKILESQSKLTDAAGGLFDSSGNAITKNYMALAEGLKVQNATLADFAEARSVVADRIAEATSKLDEAIQLRDGFKQQVADSILAFGSLLTAQAQTLNGIEQGLTSTGIIDNLKDRLTKIREFSKNLDILLTRGLSQDAYKQLVEAGPEAGADYVNAIVAGGVGAVRDINKLTGAIAVEAEKLGTAASNRLYQAGVDSAKGFLEGLQSLDDELKGAAERLGNLIAQQIKKTLGIASPSKVMLGYMANVRDGLVIGLDNAVGVVTSAAGRLGEAVSVGVRSPDLNPTSTTTASSGGKVIDMSGWTVQSDTADPAAVAHEVMNDVIAKLL